MEGVLLIHETGPRPPRWRQRHTQRGFDQRVRRGTCTPFVEARQLQPSLFFQQAPGFHPLLHIRLRRIVVHVARIARLADGVEGSVVLS